jgi:hypothetical protein
MKRMHPERVTASVRPDLHADWSLVRTRRNATELAFYRRLVGDRPCRVWLNSRIADQVSEVDLANVDAALCGPGNRQPEGRSKFFRLQHPIRSYDGVSTKNRPITSLQLKGVMLDLRQGLSSYGGVGFCFDYYFADSCSTFRRFATTRDAIGGCYLSEALREYHYLLAAYPRLLGGIVEVPMPVGWGVYDDVIWEGEELGFVIMGHPSHPPVREQVYHDALDRINAGGDFEPMKRLLRRRGQAMRVMHNVGFLQPFRHFLNLSFLDGYVLMHDLGDRRAVMRDELMDDNQFFAEAFCNLMYALTPDEQIVDQAARCVESASIAMANLDCFTTATLEGYFGRTAEQLSLNFDAFEEVFREGFEKGFSELKHPVAVSYRSLLAKQLEQSAHQ